MSSCRPKSRCGPSYSLFPNTRLSTPADDSSTSFRPDILTSSYTCTISANHNISSSNPCSPRSKLVKKNECRGRKQLLPPPHSPGPVRTYSPYQWSRGTYKPACRPQRRRSVLRARVRRFLPQQPSKHRSKSASDTRSTKRLTISKPISHAPPAASSQHEEHEQDDDSDASLVYEHDLENGLVTSSSLASGQVLIVIETAIAYIDIQKAVHVGAGRAQVVDITYVGRAKRVRIEGRRVRGGDGGVREVDLDMGRCIGVAL